MSMFKIEVVGANRESIKADGYETTDELVFAQKGDMTLLGVRTLEGFGVMVDNIGHRLVASPTIVA